MERPDVPTSAEESITLPAEPASAARARQFVRDSRSLAAHASLEDAALLCVTELVANVSLHTHARLCRLTISDCDEGLTIEVGDDEPDDLPVVEPVSFESEHGRGLRIVDALAGEWGVHRWPDDGKSVWFRLYH